MFDLNKQDSLSVRGGGSGNTTPDLALMFQRITSSPAAPPLRQEVVHLVVDNKEQPEVLEGEVEDNNGSTLITFECHGSIYIEDVVKRGSNKKSWSLVTVKDNKLHWLSKDLNIDFLKRHFCKVCNRKVKDIGNLIQEADLNPEKETRWTMYLTHDKLYPKTMGKRVELTQDSLGPFLQACADNISKDAGIGFEMVNPVTRAANVQKVILAYTYIGFFWVWVGG